MPPTLSPFGEKLRHLRRRRGLSQLDLAFAANTTPRHVSFVETGRSRPGRDLVHRISDALQLPLRDRNALLVAAGLAASYPERPLDDEALGPVRSIIERVLLHHDPYPAFAFAPGLRMLRANEAAERLFPGMTSLSPRELVTLWCTGDPDGDAAERLRDAYQVVAALRRELTNHATEGLPALLDLAESIARGHGPPPPVVEDFDGAVMCGEFRANDQLIRTVATVMRFDKPMDITVAELRVELVFPADEESDAFFRALAS